MRCRAQTSAEEITDYEVLFCGVLVALTSLFRNRVTRSFLLSLLFLPAVMQTADGDRHGQRQSRHRCSGHGCLLSRPLPLGSRQGTGDRLPLAVHDGRVGLRGGLRGGGDPFHGDFVCGHDIVVSLIPVRLEREQELHITVPESLSYSDAFDDQFATYLKKVTLVSVTSPTSTPVKNRYPARDFSVKCCKGQGFRRPYVTVPLAHTKSH